MRRSVRPAAPADATQYLACIDHGQRDVGGIRLFPTATPGFWPLTLVAAALATYGCVPETDQMPAIGLMTVGLVLIELVTRRSSEPVVILAGAATVLWSGLYGATGRASAIVGAVFALWPVVIVPVVVLLRPALRTRQEPVSWAIAFVGAVAAVAVARTGALEPTVAPALVSVAVAAPLSLALSIAIVRWSPSCRAPDCDERPAATCK